MRFQVPQFIEVESKIFGPLTLKQFIYLAGGAGLIFLAYAAFPFFIAIVLAIPIGAFSIALAFYKVNNQPFIKAVENALKYSSEAKVYVWKRESEEKRAAAAIKKKKEESAGPEIYVPKLTQSKLKDLAWSLDIKEELK
ncbi:MAG: PrgI family protein [bacterium]|nr:PrgI family protein [bacterium]